MNGNARNVGSTWEDPRPDLRPFLVQNVTLVGTGEREGESGAGTSEPLSGPHLPRTARPSLAARGRRGELEEGGGREEGGGPPPWALGFRLTSRAIRAELWPSSQQGQFSGTGPGPGCMADGAHIGTWPGTRHTLPALPVSLFPRSLLQPLTSDASSWLPASDTPVFPAARCPAHSTEGAVQARKGALTPSGFPQGPSTTTDDYPAPEVCGPRHEALLMNP